MRPSRAATAALLLAGLGAGGCSVVLGGNKLTDAQQVIADLKVGAPAGSFGISGMVDRDNRRYRVGEPIGLSFQVTQPAKVAVLRVLPNGKTTRVFPNRMQSAAAVPANTPQQLPPAGSPIIVTADKPGAVLFELIASRGDASLFTRPGPPGADFLELGATTRAIARELTRSLRIGRGGETATASVIVRVEAP